MPLRQLDRLDPAQVDQLVALYAAEWWTQGRRRADVVRMLARSSVIAFAEADTDRLVGFARLLSDGVYKALLLDVIVAPDHRGAGLGRRLLDAALAHPDAADAAHVELYCKPELAPLYERWGFTSDLGELRFLRRAT